MDQEITPYNVELSSRASQKRDNLLSEFKKKFFILSEKHSQFNFIYELQVTRNDDGSLTFYIEIPNKIKRTSFDVPRGEWKLKEEVEKSYVETCPSGGISATE